jgi:hypothetical protein
MVEGHYIAGSDDALNYHEDNTMLAQNPASGNMIESPVYTYGRNSFLWNGDEYVSCIDQPFNSHKDNQSHLNAYKEKKTPLDSLQKKKTMSKVPMFPSVGFGDHYVPGIGHPILGMSYPSFYKHYVRDTGDPVKPWEEKMTFEVYPPFGDHFIPDNGDPIKSHEVDTAADEVVQSNDTEMTNKNDDKQSTKLTCSICKRTFACRQNKEKHDRHHHFDPQDAELVKSSKTKDKEYHTKSVAKIKRETKHECIICVKTFGNARDLHGHNMRFHKDPKDPIVIAFKMERNAKRRKRNA